VNAKSGQGPPKWLRLRRTLGVLAPSIATLVLVVLLVFTVIFTALEWQWIAFLSGILFAAVLSLASASWKSASRLARRTADAERFKELYDVEREQHRRARELLERETALHQQDSERLARNADALKASADKARATASLVGILERELQEVAFVVDRELRYRFHTRGFAVWAQAQPVRIDGHLLDEPLRAQTAGAMKKPLADALHGQSGRIELDGDTPDGPGKRFVATFVPQYGLPNEVTGVLVRITDLAGTAAAAMVRSAPGHEDGSATYVASLTAELTGWEDSGARIREALAHDEFDLYVQDIVALREGTLPARMQEVLIRMRDEEETLIPPGAFLPVAEHCGLMAEIDRYVVTRVLAAQKSARGRAEPLVCINLSIATFQDASFAEFIAKALERAGVAAESLCFEFEESDVLAALEDASRQARALQKVGCRRSMDGFGATRVAFEHLKEVPIDYLKIDGRVIFEILRDSVAMAKVKAIQRVCRTIGVRTIAEQVESETTLLALRRLEVDYAQGFGIAAPRLFARSAGSLTPAEGRA
jgi:EAL domain-containing protein (putative c-di-GMP-specific phosphodiesterase class I)